MRVTELYENDYIEDLRSEVITLLTAVSAEGIDEIDTQNLLNDLEQQGFAVDDQSLMELLHTIEIVSVATPEKITIATTDADAMVGDEAGEMAADTVDNMATNQATKDLGEDMNENAEELDVGDEVIITGEVRHKGETGVIDSFGMDKRFVVVDLYNSGIGSFNSSDVSFNDYADSDSEEHDMRRSMGDDEYDRMHGDLGYNDDFDESTDRLRTLAGINKE